MNSNIILFLIQMLLAFSMLIILFIFIQTYIKDSSRLGSLRQNIKGFFIGLITDALDTWGVGAFATTTTAFKLTKYISDDRKLVGTMSVSHTIPVLCEALFFITVVKIDMTTLIPLTIATVIGSLVGTRLTRHWNAKLVEKVLAVLLLFAAAFMLFRILTNPGEHNSDSMTGLHSWQLVLAIVFNFFLGVLMTMGLGNYAPQLVFFSLMGINPIVALPLMMLNAALALVASVRGFIRNKMIDWRGLTGFTLGGSLGVILAARVVTQLDVTVLKWATIVIVLYTAGMLIYQSRQTSKR